MVALLGLSVARSALAVDPLYVKSLSPVAGLLGLPSQSSARAVDGWQGNLHTSIASHYVLDDASGESLLLDGETLRLALDLRVGFAENWTLALEVPWQQQSGGNLDSIINGWHDFWGMSDGGRSDAEDDQLEYRYLSADTGFGLDDDTSGLGDITLSLAYTFHQSDTAAASVALGYKAGTGDEDDFQGSGADDVFVALRFGGEHLTDLPLSWYGQLGYLYADDSDLLGPRQENNLWFAGVGVDWRVSENWSLLAQLDANAAPLDSDIDALGADAILLSLGARWQVASQWQLDFSFVEDVQVETGPDITFQASVRYTPK